MKKRKDQKYLVTIFNRHTGKNLFDFDCPGMTIQAESLIEKPRDLTFVFRNTRDIPKQKGVKKALSETQIFEAVLAFLRSDDHMNYSCEGGISPSEWADFLEKNKGKILK